MPYSKVSGDITLQGNKLLSIPQEVKDKMEALPLISPPAPGSYSGSSAPVSSSTTSESLPGSDMPPMPGAPKTLTKE